MVGADESPLLFPFPTSPPRDFDSMGTAAFDRLVEDAEEDNWQDWKEQQVDWIMKEEESQVRFDLDSFYTSHTDGQLDDAFDDFEACDRCMQYCDCQCYSD